MSPMKRLLLSTITIGLATAFGAYAQVNSGSAVFQNISIVPPLPFPSPPVWFS